MVVYVGRTPERVRAHYEIEKGLAARLRLANREDRKRLYGELYDELYRSVPDHPQLTRHMCRPRPTTPFGAN